MRTLNLNQLVEIIQDETGSPVAINELKKIIIENGMTLTSEDGTLLNIKVTMDTEENFVLIKIKQ